MLNRFRSLPGRFKPFVAGLLAGVSLSFCGDDRGGRIGTDLDANSVEIVVGLPLSTEQAAALESIRRETVNGGNGDDGLIETRITLDGESENSGVRTGVRSGIRAGVNTSSRSVLGEPIGLPGAPPRFSVSKLESAPPGESLGAEVRFRISKDHLKADEHRLEVAIGVEAASEIEFLVLDTSLTVARTEGREGETIEIDADVESTDIDMPDGDRDGVSDLFEVAVLAVEESPSAGVAAATDEKTKPTIAQIRAAGPKLEDSLDRLLVEQAKEEGDAAPPPVSLSLDVEAPDTRIRVVLDGERNAVESGGTTTSTSLEFEFECTKSEGCTFLCSLDGKPFSPCTSPVKFEGLAMGTHDLQVKAVDRIGNVDATPARVAWVIGTRS